MATQKTSADIPPNDSVQTGRTTIDPEDVARFSAIAEEWWDPLGKFRPLHKFNPTRLAFMRDKLCAHFNRDPNLAKPLEGLSLLDIGCGGGLLSEPMCRMGATVTGADASEKNIKTAKVHAEQQKLTINYRSIPAETLVEQNERFNIVVNMEVMEHVADLPHFVTSCANLLEPGGVMICATLNRTFKSLGLAVIGAEYILRWLPVGTHQWSQFIKPDELSDHLNSAGLSVGEFTGVTYNPISDRWSLSRDTAVNYMTIATKPG